MFSFDAISHSMWMYLNKFIDKLYCVLTSGSVEYRFQSKNNFFNSY